MKKVTYQDIKEELIEVGIQAQETFGSNLHDIRSHAQDRGNTLTWGQESDVLMSVQALYKTRLSELKADAGTATVDAAATGLSYIRKSPIDFLLTHRCVRRRLCWRMAVFVHLAYPRILNGVHRPTSVSINLERDCKRAPIPQSRYSAEILLRVTARSPDPL